jgi:hypothetical protein
MIEQILGILLIIVILGVTISLLRNLWPLVLLAIILILAFLGLKTL